MLKRVLIAVALPVALAACGGGGGGGGGGDSAFSQQELDRLRSDPRIVRLDGIIERADVLLVPSVHAGYSITVAGLSESDELKSEYTCSGIRCISDDGEAITLTDLFDATDEQVRLQDAQLGSRGGFDTAAGRAQFEFPDVAELALTKRPALSQWGFWGEYGYASVAVASGPFSGRLAGTPVSGSLTAATAIAIGDATGANPGGTGSATWHGIAEAASTRTLRHRQGTATVTIPDLSQPRASVSINISGFAIGSSAWDDMPVTGGRYGAGSVGQDYLKGDFHGPKHEETYGVFDTGAYVGAFGAKRR